MYHRYHSGCCAQPRLANVHQGFESGRRTWTADAEIAAAFRSPRKWAEALAGFLTVFLVVVALITAAGGFDRMP